MDFNKDRFNQFDACVAIASLLELVVYQSGLFSVLRAFRVLRLVKLFRSWTSLQMFIKAMIRTLMELGNMAVILMLTVFVFSLLGMQLFGGKFTFPAEALPRSNFDTFFTAALTVF